MKSLKYLVLMAVSMILFTSCISGSGNEMAGTTYGVVKYSTTSNRNIIHEVTGLYVYHPAIESLQSGDCVVYYRKINQDDEANQSASQYWTASEVTYQKIDRREMEPALKDTSVMDEGELVTVEVGVIGYVEGVLFIQASHPNSATDQTMEVSLSYNQNDEPEVVDGQNVYNLFLRTKKLTDGKSSSGTLAFESAFEFENFLTNACAAEKAKGKEVVNFRFNYIKDIDANSHASWTTSKVINYQIPSNN